MQSHQCIAVALSMVFYETFSKGIEIYLNGLHQSEVVILSRNPTLAKTEC